MAALPPNRRRRGKPDPDPAAARPGKSAACAAIIERLLEDDSAKLYRAAMGIVRNVGDRTALLGSAIVPVRALETATLAVQRAADADAYCIVARLPAAPHLAPLTVWTGALGALLEPDRKRAVRMACLLAGACETVVDESERREARRAKRSRTAAADESDSSDSSNSIPAALAAALRDLAAPASPPAAPILEDGD